MVYFIEPFQISVLEVSIYFNTDNTIVHTGDNLYYTINW